MTHNFFDDPRKAQILTRLNFYRNLIDDAGSTQLAGLLSWRIEKLYDVDGDEFKKFDGVPLTNKDGTPIVLDDDTFPYHITGTEAFGMFSKGEDGRDYFLGIRGDTLRTIIEQKFEDIRTMRFPVSYFQVEYEGKPHNICNQSSGLCFSSLTQSNK
jgi:hypothetical protein